ncbi:MAG: c-type cytochrome [Bacteriovoracales bacterium]|nr:c-type cytochrome [Bacteriovoracales bacterium]
MLKHGREVYKSRCLGCHGAKGDGRGPAAKFLDPKPRDFTSGIFKFKSTPNEALPTDSDMMRVLSMGVMGTSMPSFRLLPETSKYAVVQYIKTFSDEWKKKENVMPRIQGAPFPRKDFLNHGKFVARAKQGRKIYKENCLTCHGRSGMGDGEGGQDLTDDWDNPVKPGNLTLPKIKTGKSVRDIYLALLTGRAGTPMPSFKDALSDTELWDVTAYVLYLRGLTAGVYEGMKSPPLPEITKQEEEAL